MKLDNWARLAEIASGIAVVVTLVILVGGISDNTSATRAAVYQDLMGELNDFNLAFADDTELATEWLNHFQPDWEGLSGEFGSRIVMLSRVMFRTYDSAFHSYRTGNLGETQWQRFARSICSNLQMEELWTETAIVLSDDFVEYAETFCLQ